MQEEVIEGYRLSPQQQHLWRLLKADSHMPSRALCSIILEGDLDPELLLAALCLVVQRHEILRTSFQLSPAMAVPMQVIAENSAPTLDRLDFTVFSPEQQAARINQMLKEEEEGEPWSLERGSALRSSLVKLSAERHLLVLNLPCLSADRMSLNNLMHEIGRAYQACCDGAGLSDEPLQYADISEIFQELLESAETRIGRRYWQERAFSAPLHARLAGEPEPSLARASGFNPQRFRTSIDDRLAAHIRGRAERSQTNTSSLLLACWQVLLWRLTAQPEMSVATLYEGRTYEGLDASLGLFARYLPITAQLAAGQSFSATLQQVDQAMREAFKWQEYFTWPHTDAQSGAEFELNYWPFAFEYSSTPAAQNWSNISFSMHSQQAYSNPFKLQLTCLQREASLEIEVHYDANFYGAAQIEQVAQQFVCLLESAVKEPATAIDDLQLLSEQERRRLLLTSSLASSYPVPMDLARLFQAQVERTPEAIAVVFDEQQLSYAELNRRANRLARHLRSLGVGPESVVALLLERSPDLVISLLAVLKAGAAYLPLDPQSPPARLAYMLADAAPALLLTQAWPGGGVAGVGGVPRLLVEAEAGAWAGLDVGDVESGVTAANLAYVIYTSGSTGEPKGVAVTHANVARLFAATEQYYHFNERDVWTLFHSTAFDFSVWELWGALLYGGKLIIVSYLTSRTPAAFYQLLLAEQVTVLNQTPSAFRQLMLATRTPAESTNTQAAKTKLDARTAALQGATPQALALRLIIFGGEALDLRSLRHWYTDHDELHPQLVNMYGITETTVHVTSYRIRAADARANFGSLIGRRIDDLQLYLLDQQMRAVARGEVGEIYVGGAGLARGYLGQPALTAERFVPHPYSDQAGARLYRSGDAARYLADGTLEYVGRLDQQVKIRGYRIELGEIEAVLESHRAVRQAVVMVVAAAASAWDAKREDETPEGDETRGLVAYVVSEPTEQVSARQLRSYMQEKLPEYMIPTAFVMLGRLPLTPNGKLDRRALPPPRGAERAEPQAGAAAPRTAVEEVVCGIFAEVLGVGRVGAEENFFEAGGHSLLATRVISRVRRDFAVEVELAVLFEEPTVRGLSRKIELELGGRSVDEQERTIVAVRREADMPLSYAQQRLWFLDQLEPGNAFYNIPLAVRLTGTLHMPALAQSLGEVVRRHESLRTTFASVDGEPRQVIGGGRDIGLGLTDLSGLGEAERGAEARRLLEEEAGRSFDLGRGPLLRVELLRLEEEEHVLVCNMHHIISDGWSTGILMREVAELYRAFCKGEPSPLPEMKIQYADFAVWQREWLQGEELDRQISYWRQQLAGAPPVFQLLTDYRQPASPSSKGSGQSQLLSEPLVESLKALCQREGATLFMTLLAAFQILLSRYTNQNDVVVGTPIAGRNRSEIEDLIGFFINTLVLRTDLSGNPTFRELLSRVRQMSLGAYAHQDVPFEKLVEELQPERNLGQTPLFQIMFTLQNAPREEFDLPGLRLGRIDIESGTTKFDLSMFIVESDGKLFCTLRYKTDLFDELTISNMLRHFETLLSSIVAHPEERISALQLLTEAENRRLLYDEGPNTFKDRAQGFCLHELFEAQAAQSPNATAVVYEDEQLSYRELNRQANQLARHLRELGVGPEVRVGICLERSLEMIVALLGVLKAGGAYVALDPAFPKERLVFMLADSGVAVLLTQRRQLDRLPQSEVRIICLDEPRKVSAAESEENLASSVTGQNLAYLIYTSGSTGRPKAVAVEHRQVLNYLEGVEARLDFPAGGSFALVSTLAADLGLTMVYPSLCRGGCLHIISRERMGTPDELADYFSRHRIDCLKIVPSHLQTLLSAEHPERVMPRQRLILGGEAARREWVEELQGLAPHCVIFNHYGPTEATVGVLTYQAENIPANPHTGTLPLGRPINNVQVYLLDQYLRAVPSGAPGELYIGGDNLSRGYHNHPDLTGEKFIPHPFSQQPGARLYRTGDLARYLPDGNLQFLGRIDQQLKIRGYRIEPGEIETVLVRHPAVQEAVAVAHEEQPGDSRLVAYLVPRQQPPPTVAELRTFLAQKLPEYMIPTAFVMLGRLPLTPNGKLDRRALPPPRGAERAEPQAGAAAPRTAVEEVVCGIFAEVLGVGRVGAEENFFEAGGHSLLATRVISRVRHIFEVELPLRALFESPTVLGLSAQIEAARASGQWSEARPILPVPRGGVLPLSYAQQRLWFLDQLEPGNAFYNIPLAVRLTGTLHMPALAQSLGEVVRRHESLRTTFASVDGEPRQVIGGGRDIGLGLTDLSGLGEAERGAEARRLLEEEAGRSFDLGRGPLLRVELLRLEEEEHVLVCNMHHIISDGWSRGVLLEELTALYNAFRRGEPSPLAELEVQYADFAVWQREWLVGETLERQLAYWREQLRGVTALELPGEKTRPAVQSFRGAMLPFALPTELGKQLRLLSRREGVTLFMLLLAAFKLMLYRYTGQTDVVVGTPVANRDRLEIEPLIGFFINTLALRTQIDPESSFRELLRGVRATTLAAYAHQDVPFEKLVEALQPERDMSRQPLFQVMFTLENAPAQRLTVDGLSLRGEAVAGVTSKFDLTLTMEETEQGGLAAALEYSTDLFTAEAIARMAENFAVLLEGIAAEPEQKLSRLPLLSAVQEHQLLFDWNATEAAYPRHKCAHHLIEEQAERTPEAVAVRCGGRQITYAELNSRAAQLASHLQSLGVGPEVRVGLLAGRSVEMFVGMLAILKAGGAYLPLDPQYPQERLSYMLADAGVSVLLTQKGLAQTLPAHSARVVSLDEDWDETQRDATDKPSAPPGPDNLAYMIYTSGSTGRPKGVLISHRNLVHSTTARFCYYQQKVRGFLLLSSFAFDSSVAGIFWTLCQGGTLLLPQQEYQQDLSNLIRLIAADKPSHMLGLPALYALLMEQAKPEQLASLETVIVAGEACPGELIELHQSVLPQATLFNEYGPTEGTVWSSVYQCRSQAPTTQVPIGRPISNMQAYILDADLQLVPVGSPGQLHIGGAGLARGYHNHPDLTGEKFIPHPFSQQPGARLYRTGDLARYLPDGNLQFLGRIDQQLKIRGHRIELGEIEAVLQQHESLKEVAVVAQAQGGGDQRLVAYLVPQPHNTPEPDLLRRFLKERLPDYMHPSGFILLDGLPLMPNGKLDRRALAELEQPGAELRATFVAPRSATECALAQIWEDLLGVSRIGIEEDFFAIGGHSLLAVRLMARVEQQFGVELPLSTLFRGATIAALARRISESSATVETTGPTATPVTGGMIHPASEGGRGSAETEVAGRSPLVAIQPEGTRPPFFCVHAIGGEVLSFYHLARYLGSAQPFYGLQAARLHEMGNEEASISGSAAEYLAAIRVVQPEGPYLLGGYSYGAIVAYEMALQLEAVGEEAALLAVLDTSAPRVLQGIESDEVGLLVGLAWSTARQAEKYLLLSEELMREMNSEQRLRHFVEQMGAAGLAPADVEIRLLRNFLAGHRARQQAVRQYQPRATYGGVITLFRCAEADSVMQKEMERAGIEVTDGVKGWSEYSERMVEVYEVAGHHNRMCEEPYVGDLAEKLGNSLHLAGSEIVARTSRRRDAPDRAQRGHEAERTRKEMREQREG